MIVDETNQIVNDIQSQMNFFDSSFKSISKEVDATTKK